MNRNKIVWTVLVAAALALVGVGYSVIADSGKPQLVVERGKSNVYDRYALSPNGELMVVVNQGNRGKIIIWDMVNRRVKSRIAIDFGVDSIEISPDNKTVLLGGTGKERKAIVNTYNLSTGRLRLAIKAGESAGCDEENPARFALNGKVIISGSEDKTAWSSYSGKKLRVFKSPIDGHYISPFDISSDGKKLLIGYIGGSVKIWDIGSGKLVKVFKENDHPISFVAYNPNGRTVVSWDWNDQFLRFWEISTGKVVMKYMCSECWFSRFSPDGKMLATGQIQMVNVETGKILREIDTNTHPNQFTKDNKTLISSQPSRLLFWEVDSGELKYQMVVYNNGEWVIYSPDGYFDASPGAKSKIKWKVGEKTYPAMKFWDKYHRPGLFTKVMQGKIR